MKFVRLENYQIHRTIGLGNASSEQVIGVRMYLKTTLKKRV